MSHFNFRGIMSTKKYSILILICAWHYTLFAQTIPEENLILHFNFDNNQLEDLSPKGHGFINHNLEFGEGIDNTGLLLNGIDAFLEIPHSTKLEVSGTLTTSLWYLHEVQETTAFYSLIEQSADEAGGHSRYGTWVFDRRKVLVCIEPDICTNGGLFCQRCITSSQLLEDGKWYHIVSTYSGDTLRVFSNGELTGERFFDSATGISTRPYPLTIGTDMYDGSPVYLKGTVDDVRVYDVNLSSNQVAMLFNEFRGTTSAEEIEQLTFSIFPNPTTDFIQLNGVAGNGHYIIMNAQGQVLKSADLNGEKVINIQFLDKGFYFIEYRDGVQIDTKSFVVNK